MQNPHDVPPTGAPSSAAGTGRAKDETLNENSASVGEGLGFAASTVDREDSGLPEGEALKETPQRATDALSSTADYVRNNNLKGMVSDAQRLVRNNPGPALFTAAVLGFLVGRTLSRL
jgi:ElaB/YqjD/DUF883 family membrane-anchored ribosome-binding protein